MDTPTRVLWVTFDFPPRMSSGAYRPIRVYKYVDHSAFRLDFVTHGASRRFARAVTDDSLLREVAPAPRVFRVPVPIPHDALFALVGRLRRRKPAAPAVTPAPGAEAGSSEPPTQPRRRRSGLYERFAMWAYFPDHLFVWGWLTALRCVWLHLKNGYDVVYTTSFPESAHLAGLFLNILGVPWVVDYRYGGPLWIKKLVGFRKSDARQARDHRFQRLVMRRADCVVTQCEPLRADFCEAFALDASRVHVVPSGFDESDFAGRERDAMPFTKRPGEIHLLHLGTMEGVQPEDVRRLVEALNRLHDGLAGHGHRLVVHAVGSDVLDAGKASAAFRFAYERHGVVVHRDVPPYLFAADCFLLSTITAVAGNDQIRGFVPSKLWEYLRAKRPILMTGPKDAVWSVLEREGVGIDMGESAETPVSPADLIDRVRSVPLMPGTLHQYSWQSRAEALQQIFLTLHRTRAAAHQGAPIG